MKRAIGRVVCGVWAFALAQAAAEWLLFLWLAQGTAWGPLVGGVAAVSTVAAVWTLGGWAMNGRWPERGSAGPLLAAAAATLLDAAQVVFWRGPIEHYIDGAPFGALDVVDIALTMVGVACAVAAFFKLLPPRSAAQPDASARP
jgi:hypothetical protein